MRYTSPVVIDYGNLAELTQASGMIGAEDGVGKTIQAGGQSVPVFP